jgi:hypothetical protein
MGFAIPMMIGTTVAALSVFVSMLFSPETKGTAMVSDIQAGMTAAHVDQRRFRAPGQGRSFRDKDRTGFRWLAIRTAESCSGDFWTGGR